MSFATVFTEQDVARLIAMPKRAHTTASVNRPAKPMRDTPAEIKKSMIALPEDATLQEEFYITECRLEESRSYDISLHVKVKGMARLFLPIVRFEIQESKHTNPPWFKPKSLEPGQPHCHIYNPRAEKESGIWHLCAEPVDLGNIKGLSPKQEQARLKNAFMNRLNLRFADCDAANELFDKG